MPSKKPLLKCRVPLRKKEAFIKKVGRGDAGTTLEKLIDGFLSGEIQLKNKYGPAER